MHDRVILPEVTLAELEAFLDTFEGRMAHDTPAHDTPDVERFFPVLRPPPHLRPAIEKATQETRQQVREARAAGVATISLGFPVTPEFAELIRWLHARVQLAGTRYVPEELPEPLVGMIELHRQLIEAAAAQLPDSL